MPVLHGTDGFELTPEYNATLADWALLNPDQPDPRFTDAEVAALTFTWPQTPTGKLTRRRNGRFAKKGS